jgi:hypothetical protein
MKIDEVIIVHPHSHEQLNAIKAFMKAFKIKFEVSTEQSYNPDFVAKIEESKKQYENGDFISIEAKDIDSFLEIK